MLEHLALIILNYNSYDDSVSCVDKLLSFGMMLHIVVVDNCSTDDSYTRLFKKYRSVSGVDVIQSERNGGYGYGNNFGIKYASQKYDIDKIAILNPDIILPDISVLEKLTAYLDMGADYAIAGGVIQNVRGDSDLNRSVWDVPSGIEQVLNQSLFYDRFKRIPVTERLSQGLFSVGCIAGCFFVAKLDHFTNIGMFDENIFLYNEEDSLGIRCRKSGYKEIMAGEVHYIHNHHDPDNDSLTFAEKVHATRYSYRSAAYLCKTYYSPILLPLLWMVELCNRLYLIMAYFKHKVLE